jgi:small-conductance mechanosensitive channel
MDMMMEMRNEVMHAIFQTFKENKIEIPLPRRDLYIKNLADEMAKVDLQKADPASENYIIGTKPRKSLPTKGSKKNPPNTNSEDKLS